MRRSGSADARRLAMTQPAVPPTNVTVHSICQKRETEGEEEEDDIPPAMIISYSSLVVMGEDIVTCFCKVDVVEKNQSR